LELEEMIAALENGEAREEVAQKLKIATRVNTRETNPRTPEEKPTRLENKPAHQLVGKFSSHDGMWNKIFALYRKDQTIDSYTILEEGQFSAKDFNPENSSFSIQFHQLGLD